MTEPLPRDDVRVRLVADTFKHRWLRILLLAIVVGGVLGTYMFTRPTPYRSTSIVLLRPLQGNALSSSTAGDSGSNTVAMETEASLVSSEPVTDQVNHELGTSLPANASAISVSVPVNSQIVKISCKLSKAHRAQQCAQEYARQFLTFREDLASAAQKAELEKLQAQLGQAQADLRTATDQASGQHPQSDAQTRVKLYTANLSSLLSKIATLQSTSTDPGSVILDATRPSTAGRTVPVALTAGGFLLGGLVGFVLGLWREHRQDLVRTPAEPLVAGLPILGVIPYARDVAPGELPGHDEALRRLRVGVLAAAADRRILGVSGVGASTDQGAIAAQLAETLAVAGYRVTLVDAMPSDESAEPLIDVTEEIGLAELLDDPDAGLPVAEVNGVRVVPAGAMTTQTTERLASNELKLVLQRLCDASDFVVVACGEATNSGGLGVALAVNGMILVGVDGRSKHVDIANATSGLDRLNVEVIGVALQQVVPRKLLKAIATASRSLTKRRGKLRRENKQSLAPARSPRFTHVRAGAADTPRVRREPVGGTHLRAGALRRGKQSGDNPERTVESPS